MNKSKSSASYRKLPSETEPLILTPYLESGKILKAQGLSYVEPLLENHVSYSGFFTVNKIHDSNMFFWFFESCSSPRTDPILLCLRGGIGSSSLQSLFEDNGPFIVTDETIQERECSWTKKCNVLYVDNPVGAGFSFARRSAGYCKNDDEIVENLYEFLRQFTTMFPRFKDNHWYFAAESYASKYAVLLATLIHQRQKRSPLKMNLKGLFMGCPFIDPMNQIKYADFLRMHFVINERQHRQMLKHERAATRAIALGKYLKAWYHISCIYLRCCRSGFNRIIDVRDPKYNSQSKNWVSLIQSIAMRNTLHVGNEVFGNRIKLIMNVRDDILRSVLGYLPALIEDYKILVYGAEFDMLVVYDNLNDILSRLQWDECRNFAAIELEEWTIDDQLMGYKKSAGNFTQVKIMYANHLATRSQPKSVFELLRHFAK